MKNYTIVELIVVLFFVAIFACFVMIGILGYKAYKSVNENGLKNTIDKVWEGPNKGD